MTNDLFHLYATSSNKDGSMRREQPTEKKLKTPYRNYQMKCIRSLSEKLVKKFQLLCLENLSKLCLGSTSSPCTYNLHGPY